jgi:hypothetical protein
MWLIVMAPIILLLDDMDADNYVSEVMRSGKFSLG